MFGRRKCYCMNNNYQNNSCEEQNDIMEDKCSNIRKSNVRSKLCTNPIYG